MSEHVDTSPLSGGGAPVTVYAASAVVTLPADGRLVGIVSARDMLGAFTMSPA